MIVTGAGNRAGTEFGLSPSTYEGALRKEGAFAFSIELLPTVLNRWREPPKKNNEKTPLAVMNPKPSGCS